MGLAATGVVSACYNNISGILRVATTKAPCIVAGNPILREAPWLLETQPSWDQIGPVGATGATGPTGATGAAGEVVRAAQRADVLGCPGSSR